MSGTNARSQEVSVAQTDEQQERGEDGAREAETPELRASVEQDIQATVDLNHPDATPAGLPLEARERMLAREIEIGRTRQRIDRRQASSREARSRSVASAVGRERRASMDERAMHTNRWDRQGDDPREKLTRSELGDVNQAALRVAETTERASRATISRLIAERVVAGAVITSAVLSVTEDLQMSGQYTPIGRLEAVAGGEVDIQGTVTDLWTPSSASIAQVGLLEDETGRVKVTVWKNSGQPWMEEGERVQLYDAATNWYQGRVSVALTGWSRIEFPDRGRWWASD